MFGFGYDYIFGAGYGGMGLSQKKQRKLAQWQNDTEYVNWLTSLFNMALSVFIWDGLPETCSARFLEQSLLIRGQAIITREENGSHLSLGAAPSGNYNVYGEPTKCWGWGLNGFNKEYDLYIKGDELNEQLRAYQGFVGTANYNAVLCWDNKLRYPYINHIITAARRLADTERTTDIIAKNLKQPVWVTCREEQVKSVREALRSRDVNEDTVISSGDMLTNDIGVLDTGVNPDTMRVMYERFDHHLSLIHSIFGIDSAAQSDKRERLLVDEVNANNKITASNIQKRLHMREDFCENVKAAFGVDLSVRLNPELFQEGEEILTNQTLTGGNVNRGNL